TAASGGGNGRGSTQGVVDQIIGEISWLQLDLDPVALAGKRTGHNDVTLDPRRDQPKHAPGTLQLWVKVWVDDLFLPSQPRERLFLVETLDRLLAGDYPIALPGPACGGERLGITLGDADLVDMLAEADVRGPPAKFGAARDVEDRHPVSPIARASDCPGITVTHHSLHRVS